MPKKRKLGQIVKINLDSNNHVYGCNLINGNVAIFDTYSDYDLDSKQIIEQPILFTVGVLDVGFSKWKKVDIVSLNKQQCQVPNKFIQDVANLSNIRIVDSSGNERPGNFDEAKMLERVLGWHHYHVEQRVSDYYNGKTNWMVEFYRPKPPIAPHFRPTEIYIPKLGTIKKIDMWDGTYVFGHELPNSFMNIYDFRSMNPNPPDNIAKSPVLFTVSVSLSSQLGWEDVGFSPLKHGVYSLPDRYMIDIRKPDDIKIYDGESVLRSGTLKDILGLEPAVKWDNYHIVNRLHAHYSGSPWIF